MITIGALSVLISLLLMTAPASTSISEASANCSLSDGACLFDDEESVCPPDSLKNPIKDDVECMCVPERCVVPPCRFGTQRVLKKKGSNTPGDCCDIYDCVQPQERNCSEVECPDDGKECPPDSYRLPNHKGLEDCCSIPQGCSCFPRPCPTPNCNSDQQSKIVRRGNGKPGTCCPVFECVSNDSNITCTSDDKIIESGSEWWKDDCTKCTCNNGQVYCDTMPVCLVDGTPPVHPSGCMSGSGKVLQHGESWQEDPCTSCTCIDGNKKCQAYMCEVSCVNPTYVPDECCPLCNSSSVVLWPEHCPALNNCSLKCVNGFVRDSAGCFTCQCREGECLVKCTRGYAQDSYGNKLCECAEEDKCPPLVDCHKTCAHGFRVNKAGCEVCKCNQCRPMTECTKKCVFGFKTNDRGCPICKCKAFPEQFTDLSSQEVSKATCVSTDGQSHEEGEMWFDECRECYCHGGAEMCSLITCPTPLCDNPLFNSSSGCCPQCPGDNNTQPQHNAMVCQSVDGIYRVEGETWQLNECTHCLCHFGRVLCETRKCPPVPCKQALTPPGSCCAMCISEIDTPDFVSDKGKSCGTHHPDGAMWREGACQSCACRSGSVQCYSEPCPETKCARPLLAKNRCCPMCLDSHDKVCTIGNITYQDGDEWNENPCTHCVCIEGVRSCTEYVCSAPCEKPVMKDGECCPQCPKENDSGTSDSSDLLPSPASPGPAPQLLYIVIICLLMIILISMGVFMFCRFCHRGKHVKLHSSPKSCPNPAYNGYTHQNSEPPPQYNGTERHSKCGIYKYDCVPTYDMQPIEDTVKTPIDMLDKSSLAPV